LRLLLNTVCCSTTQ
jgi:hypothetical protein